jgi:hypothetical protein
MWLTLLYIVIFAACLGLLYNEGMWNNGLRLINVVTAALLATNFYEPAATWLDRFQPSLSYLCDFLALWVLFGLFASVFRALTDEVSKVKVRFLNIADRIGSVFFAICIAWVLICFAAMTLHTAPLSREFLFGSFKPEQRQLMGLAPDRQWLGFMQRVSRGQFSRSATPKQQQEETFVFDPHADFLLKHASRRTKLENQMQGPDASLTVGR